jgi:3-(3-hydroxy-phenyl)propionate hydroxylase
MNTVSVLIAGAGPSGAVAAYRLAQMGVDVLLLESHAQCPEDMRASTFHPPTLDMMEALGLLDTLEAQGLRAPVYQYRNRATGEVLSLDMGEIADVARHPYRLQCEQFKLTRLIAGKLADHPHGRILFQRRLTHYVQDGSGVTATVETPTGIETYRCDYLIGADGANSLIRKMMGVEFSGFTYPEKFLTLSTAYPVDAAFKDLAYVAYMADPQEWCVLIRVVDFWRVLVPALETDDDKLLMGDAKKDAVFDALVGRGEAVITSHRTVYRVHQRVADRYRRGRVILMGDAAHLNNPLGGFGMNSGVHDAWNLTDKLAAIVLDKADPDTELDRYDRQRRTVMQEFVQAQTMRNKRALEAGAQTAQDEAQAQLAAVIADPDKRRDYILSQAMIKSRMREAEIA